MKAIKYFALSLAALFALVLIIAAVGSKQLKYEQSIDIAAPLDTVWANVSSLQAMEKWNPWIEKDPNLKAEYKGAVGEVGSSYHWQSQMQDVGNGSQTITGIVKHQRVTTDLKFSGETESQAKAFVKLEEHQGTVRVTWGFESEMPFPINAMLLFMDAEDMLGEDYRKGLTRLKSLSEQG